MSGSLKFSQDNILLLNTSLGISSEAVSLLLMLNLIR